MSSDELDLPGVHDVLQYCSLADRGAACTLS